MDQDAGPDEKPVHRKTLTQENLDPEKHGINMPEFRKLFFINAMRKVRLLTDI